MKSKIILGLFAVNILLVIVSGLDKGRDAFFAIPIMLLINLVFSIYGYRVKNDKLGNAALIFFFVMPIIAFIVFANAFPFLTR